MQNIREVPYHTCTLEEIAEFYPMSEADRSLVDLDVSKGKFFCVDNLDPSVGFSRGD